ncbi:peptide deformylase [Dehalobacterium formicoaceticum]|uniref:peptide deformylase n=1 Tax=Dehalobacterium formicoaceticum TaxID=51515 RepID=UPI000B7F1A64|nr:peptide deformylase [Dehalobacterium formicoaceticum]
MKTAVYEIVKIGDPLLREKAKKVPKVNANIEKLLDNMADTMRAADGVGLAAPQIGISKCVVVIDVGEGLIELINPEIIAQEGHELDAEGCLSVPDMQGKVMRALKVTVKGLDRRGQDVHITGEGLLARALQHEIDHLHGVLFVDRMVK